MKFVFPQRKYSEDDYQIIKDNYELYLSELNDTNKLKIYVDKKLFDERKNLKEKEKYLMIFLYSIVNLLFAILCITVFKEEKFVDIIVYTVCLGLGLFFIPVLIHSFLVSIKTYLLKDLINKIFFLKITYEKEYKEYVNSRYKNIIDDYNNCVEEENRISDIKRACFQFISNTVRQSSFDDLKKMIIWYLKENGNKVYESKKKELCVLSNNKKILIIIKRINRSLSITDVIKINEQRLKQKFDNAYLFYIGRISDKAHKYCVRNNIILFNEKNIVTKLCELKLKKDNYVE